MTIAMLFDLDRSLIEKKTTTFKAYCKLGRHGILVGTKTIWLNGKHPLGLSCLPCAKVHAPEAVAAEEARLAEEAKAAGVSPTAAGMDFTRMGHGKVSTYNKGCRCQPCRTANTQRSIAYKRARREQLAGRHDAAS